MQVALEWSRRDTTIKTSHALHHHAAKLLSCANEPHPLVVYCNGEVGVVEGETCWLAPKKKRWRLCLAEVLPDCRVCVVGMDKHVTVGIAQLADGQPEQPLVNNLDLKGEDLVSCCVCGDKLLLLGKSIGLKKMCM